MRQSPLRREPAPSRTSTSACLPRSRPSAPSVYRNPRVRERRSAPPRAEEESEQRCGEDAGGNDGASRACPIRSLEQMNAEHAAKIRAHETKQAAEWVRFNGMAAAFDELPRRGSPRTPSGYQAKLAMTGASAGEWQLAAARANTVAPPKFDPRRPEQFIPQLREARELHLLAPGETPARGQRVLATLADVSRAAEASMRRSGTMRAAAEALTAGRVLRRRVHAHRRSADPARQERGRDDPAQERRDCAL